jgi:hypothetical protein
MKRYLLLMPVILATAAALADTHATSSSGPVDAQAHAAALLSGPHLSALANTLAKTAGRSSSPSDASAGGDAHEFAAALLRGHRTGNQVRAVSSVVEPTGVRISVDAHAHARALLGGARASTRSQAQMGRTQNGARPSGKAF